MYRKRIGISFVLALVAAASLAAGYAVFAEQGVPGGPEVVNDPGERRDYSEFKDVTLEQHEAAIQSAFDCLEAEGMEPVRDDAKGLRVSGFKVKTNMSDMDAARAIIERCRAQNHLDEISLARSDQAMARPESEKQAARQYYAACVLRQVTIGDDQVVAEGTCYDETEEVLGIPPMDPR